MILSILVLASLTSASTFNSEIFLKANPSVYTPTFCRNLKSIPVISVFHEFSPAPQKKKAFEAFFNGCREEFLAAELAVEYVTYLLLTGNEEQLSLLLQFKGNEKLKLSANNLQNLGTMIYSAAPEALKNRLFALDAPHELLATLLEHCSLNEGNPRDQLQLLRNYIDGHWRQKDDSYADFGAVERGVRVLDYYLKNPEHLGARKGEVLKVVEVEYLQQRRGSQLGRVFIVGGLLSIMATAIVLLSRTSKKERLLQ